MITSEGILTSPHGFGLATATPVQRAGCRARDGLPLAELREHPDVIAAFGGEDAIAALPSERGIKPLEFYDVSAPRTAKTMRAVCGGIVAAHAIDLTDLKVGEVPRVSILSLKLDVADVPFRLLSTCLQHSQVLSPLLVKVGTDSVEVRHPSGRLVEIAVVAGGRAAGGLVARWSAGLIADEGTRMVGAEDGVANLPEALSAIRERLLPGAQIQVIGQPHAPFGPTYDIFQQYFGHPTDEIVVMRTAGPAGNPMYWTPERLEKLRRRDEAAWRVAMFADFLSPASSMFSSGALDDVTRSHVEFPPGTSFAAAMDPATRANSWTLVILGRRPCEPPTFGVASAMQWTGTRLHPLSPSAVMADVAFECSRFGVRTIITDQWMIDAVRDEAARRGLAVEQQNQSTVERVQAYESLRTAIDSGAIDLLDVPQLREDLLRVRKRITQTGITIDLPRTSDGRHCDFAPAIALAFHAASSAPRPMTADELRQLEEANADLGGFSRWDSFPFDHGFG